MDRINQQLIIRDGYEFYRYSEPIRISGSYPFTGYMVRYSAIGLQRKDK